MSPDVKQLYKLFQTIYKIVLHQCGMLFFWKSPYFSFNFTPFEQTGGSMGMDPPVLFSAFIVSTPPASL